MIIKRYTYGFLIGLVLVISCNDKSKVENETLVYHSGALREIMSGNTSAVIDLYSLSSLNQLYALGAVEGLKGEIQIFNGEAFNSSVLDSALIVSNSFDQKASLLVYAQVKEWASFELFGKYSKSELEIKIRDTAKEYGIDVEKPFTFLIKGKIASLNWHVINWDKNDTIHTHQKHKSSGLKGKLNNKDVQILGFHSIQHKGVFTHHTTNMHLHFRSNDNLVAGHVDDIEIDGNFILKLPKR